MPELSEPPATSPRRMPRRSDESLRAAHATVIVMREEAECVALGAFLGDRIHEFNARVTGYMDGLLLAGCIRNHTGEVIAGYNGHTWGGCCELSNLWVHEQHRGQGFGTELVRSAEAEARVRGCVQVVLRTHSFQAPGFYERMGYECKHTIEGCPSNHADIIYAKRLRQE